MRENLNMREDLNILNDFPAPPHDEWLAAVDKQLKGRPFEKALVKKTYEGIDIQPMYFKHDLEPLPQKDALPGFAPYVRGNRASGNRIIPWQVAQEILEPDPVDLNKTLLNDLARGQDTISLRLDRAGLNGQDPDKAKVSDVGVNGLSLSTANDWARVLDKIDLGKTPLHVDSGLSAMAATALLSAHLEKNSQTPARLKGCIGLDPLGRLAVDGSIPQTIDAAFDEMACLTKWAVGNTPELKTITVNVVPYADAGANAVQELAIAVSTGTAYIRAMQERRLEIDEICPRIQFSFGIGPDFFMEIAKFRASRMVWHNIAKAFGVVPEEAKMFIHGRTQQYNKTQIDPWVNMLRVSTEAFSGIAGGCDSLHVGPFDEVIRQPDEFSRRIARNIHSLFKEEAHFDKVADPGGGSWYIETITLQLAQKAWHLFQEIEGMGGMEKALSKGFIQQQVDKTQASRAKNTAVKKERIVGVSVYPNLLEKPLAPREFDTEAFLKNRRQKVKQDLESVDAKACSESLKILSAIQNFDSTQRMEAAVSAAKAGATLGELAEAIRSRSGSTAITPLKFLRRAEPFEKLRKSVEAHQDNTGEALKIFMANMGPLARHKPRSDFATAFFNVTAFETVFTPGFDTPKTAAEQALESGAKAVVICGTDDNYMETVPALTQQIKAAKPDTMVIVAGFSPAYVELFKEAGVDEFIHLRADALAILERLHAHLMPLEGEKN